LELARVTLERNVKFKALIKALEIPKPYVRGLLETMWDVAAECGNPVLGTEEDVELAAEWPGEPGLFFKAVMSRWVDQLPDGRWQIHDYFDHAPDYVLDRRRKELSRKNKGLHQICPEKPKIVHEFPNGLEQISGTPAPAPAPLKEIVQTDVKIGNPVSDTPKERVPAETLASPRGGHDPVPAETRESLKSDHDGPEGFKRFWIEWPKHHRKVGKAKCIRFWQRSDLEPIAEMVIESVRRCKVSPDWSKERGAFVPMPLSWLNDTPWETDPSDLYASASCSVMDSPTKTTIRGEI